VKLRQLGSGGDLAAQTADSPCGPWRLAKRLALNYAFPVAYFDSLGLPLSSVLSRNLLNRRTRTRIYGGWQGRVGGRSPNADSCLSAGSSVIRGRGNGFAERDSYRPRIV
jgi:hypothetical protein